MEKMEKTKIKVNLIDGSALITGEACEMNAGEYMVLEENHIAYDKKLTFSFTKDKFADDDLIRLGHGERQYCGAYLELTSTKIQFFQYFTDVVPCCEFEHGLNLDGRVNLVIDDAISIVRVTISTASGLYQSPAVEGCWGGRNGEIFAVSLNSSISDVKMRWYSPAYERKIWLFGDSYFNATSALRWPYYLVQAGYTDFLMSGFPGRDCHAALVDLKQALKHGTPEYIVWCMGMNNSDNPDSINQCFLRTATELAEICKDKNINLILSTIPCVPERYNSFKNDWVRKSGYRYIDFAAAVGAEAEHSPWYDGMLYEDKVHPAKSGAMALYAQVITDFPEIMR